MLSPAEMSDMSLQYAMAKDREAWLALLADDVCVRDPVGPAPWDPEGKGWIGKKEVTRFWDTVISQNAGMKFVVHERYVGGNQCASLLSLHITQKAGDTPVVYRGIAIHTINDAGKMIDLRTYLTPATSRHQG